MSKIGGNPQNLIPAKKGEVRNPKGGPRKTINVINSELEAEGYTEASKQDILSCYLRLINTTIPQIEDMVKDKTQPALIRVVGKAILSGKGFDVIDKMLDRGIGRAPENINMKYETTIEDARKYLLEKLAEKRPQKD